MAGKSWSLTTPADDVLKNTVPELIRDIKQHAQVACGFFAEAQTTPDRTVAIYAGIAYFSITKVEYAGLDIVDLGPSGAFEVSALTADYYNKILFTIDSSGTLAKTEGTEHAVLASVVEPAIPEGKFPICMISVQDDGTATAGTILTIEQDEIAQIQGVSTPSVISDTAYADSWNGVTTIAPSKNAVYDEMELQFKKILTAAGDIGYASAANVLARLAKGTAGQILTMNAGATAPEWVTGSGGLYKSYLKYSETQTSGTNGGTSSATTYHIRTLNTEDADTRSIGSLASNKVTLPAGSYVVKATAPCWEVEQTKLFIWDDTNSAYILIGQTGRIPATVFFNYWVSVTGLITLATTVDLEVHHYTQRGQATNGLGEPAAISGISEVYTTLELWELN